MSNDTYTLDSMARAAARRGASDARMGLRADSTRYTDTFNGSVGAWLSGAYHRAYNGAVR